MESVNSYSNPNGEGLQKTEMDSVQQVDEHLNVTMALLTAMTFDDEAPITSELFNKWEQLELQKLESNTPVISNSEIESNVDGVHHIAKQEELQQQSDIKSEEIPAASTIVESDESITQQEQAIPVVETIPYCPTVVNTHSVYNFPLLMQKYNSFTDYYKSQREAELQRQAQESLYREQVLMSRFNHSFGTQVQIQYQNIVIPAGWEAISANSDAMEDLRKIYQKIREFIMMGFTVFPREENIFKAFELCPLDNVNVVIIGQDAYETRDKILGIEKACGLAFSGRKGGEIPISLQKIFAEIKRTFPGIPLEHADLTSWAQQGVLLLNAALSVNEGNPDSHGKTGMYKFFIEFIVKLVSERRPNTIWCLWGRKAEALEPFIGKKCHILKSGHPSGRNNSDYKFAENNHFAYIYYLLQQMNKPQINWTLVNY